MAAAKKGARLMAAEFYGEAADIAATVDFTELVHDALFESATHYRAVGRDDLAFLAASRLVTAGGNAPPGMAMGDSSSHEESCFCVVC